MTYIATFPKQWNNNSVVWRWRIAIYPRQWNTDSINTSVVWRIATFPRQKKEQFNCTRRSYWLSIHFSIQRMAERLELYSSCLTFTQQLLFPKEWQIELSGIHVSISFSQRMADRFPYIRVVISNCIDNICTVLSVLVTCWKKNNWIQCLLLEGLKFEAETSSLTLEHWVLNRGTRYTGSRRGEMDSLERLISSGSHQPALTAATRSQNAFVQANLCSVIGRKGRHLTGTFCLTGDTMEGIIQCLVFLKAFSVRDSMILYEYISKFYSYFNIIICIWIL